jgi:hypothetical protein
MFCEISQANLGLCCSLSRLCFCPMTDDSKQQPSPSFAELDNTLKNGEEFLPTEAELKGYDFRPLSDWTGEQQRNDGSTTFYCAKSKTYRYQNQFWRDKNRMHYYLAVPLGSPENPGRQRRRQVACLIEAALDRVRSLLVASPDLKLTDLFDDDATIVKVLRTQQQQHDCSHDKECIWCHRR